MEDVDVEYYVEMQDEPVIAIERPKSKAEMAGLERLAMNLGGRERSEVTNIKSITELFKFINLTLKLHLDH